MKVSGQRHAPAALSPVSPGTHWKGWMDPGAGLKDLKKKHRLPLLGFEPQLKGVNYTKFLAFFLFLIHSLRIYNFRNAYLSVLCTNFTQRSVPSLLM